MSNTNEDKIMLNIYTSDQYNSEIEGIVTATRMSYLDAIQHHAEENSLEPETVAELISSKVKNKLREEAEALHFLPKISKLPI